MHELRSIYCDQFASVNRRPNAFTGQGLLPIKIHLVGMSVISKSFISYTLIDYFNAQNAVNGFQSHVKQTFFFRERNAREKKLCFRFSFSVSSFMICEMERIRFIWTTFFSHELNKNKNLHSIDMVMKESIKKYCRSHTTCLPLTWSCVHNNPIEDQ